MPDIPTADETGVPGLYMSGWFGFFAPKGTPKDIIAKLNAATVEALADPAIQKRFTELGLDVAPREQQTPEGLAAFQKAEIAKWWPIIKAPASARRRSDLAHLGRLTHPSLPKRSIHDCRAALAICFASLAMTAGHVAGIRRRIMVSKVLRSRHWRYPGKSGAPRNCTASLRLILYASLIAGS